MRRVVRRERADWLFSMSGAATPGCGIRQAALAMNPWCLVPDAHRGAMRQVKAALQRRAYRDAVRDCDAMVYLSAYLRDAYHANAGHASRHAIVRLIEGSQVEVRISPHDPSRGQITQKL